MENEIHSVHQLYFTIYFEVLEISFFLFCFLEMRCNYILIRAIPESEEDVNLCILVWAYFYVDWVPGLSTRKLTIADMNP